MSDHELPRYRSHKIVRALKLAEIEFHTVGIAMPAGATLHPDDDGFDSIRVDQEFADRIGPDPAPNAGYYVLYEDEYASWSPTEAFEEGYVRLGDSIAKHDPDLENRFTYHTPKGDQPQRYHAIRETAKQLAYLITESVPAGREKSLALTKLEEVSMWANAGIARETA